RSPIPVPPAGAAQSHGSTEDQQTESLEYSETPARRADETDAAPWPVHTESAPVRRCPTARSTAPSQTAPEPYTQSCRPAPYTSRPLAEASACSQAPPDQSPPCPERAAVPARSPES